MNPLQQAIGIFGGTFDPIHFGHLRSALEIYQAFNLAEIRFIPCYQPVHKPPPIATVEDRLAMLRSAIQDEPFLKVDLTEIQRKGPSYMVDTLESLHKELPQSPLCLIIGMDALLDFTTWHRWADILKIAHLLVMHRSPFDLPSEGVTAELLTQYLKTDRSFLQKTLSGSIFLYPVTRLEISATDIRRQISMGLNSKFLLPDNVYKYIHQHGIYGVSRI